MLITLAGLPGSGKTAIAAELARRLGAVYLRIDSMEQAIRDSDIVSESVHDAGYRVGYAVAEDNLRVGRTGPTRQLPGPTLPAPANGSAI